MHAMRHTLLAIAVTGIVAALGTCALVYRWPIGPMVLGLAAFPLAAIRLSGRRFSAIVPDLVFGGIDTGLLTIPALAGGVAFGVAGAIAGGVIGDALTDAIAGFCEGHVATWLRRRGFEESREGLTTAMGKMAGCLLGSGAILTAAMILGVRLQID